MNSILIVGCGFVGNEVVRQCQASHQRPVFALTRTADRVAELRAAGATPVVGHWQDASTLTSLPAVETLLIAVPHREDSGLGIQSHVEGLKNLVQSQKTVRKLIYLSTTGVYGDAHDEVDELTPTQPTRIGPQIAVAAEQWLAERFTAPQLAIIRLAGIYGPGRVPLAEKLRAGEILQVPQAGWLNLVHVADIAAMLLQVTDNELQHSLYVFSDGKPVPRMDFYRTLAKLCGVDEPKFAEPDPLATRSMRAGKKRVNPQRLMDELKFALQFPSYQEGLADSVR
ncbi:MAG: NAD-dependent epimerase/dehydratase family protein [Pirellulaceae bacterium]|nr:NAD-dependent epimerase/dehydratase family protein [Pirellulaceae bacterium]